MTYNKSEIMKKAWVLFRTGNYSKFSHTLEQAWREAKKVAEARANGAVTASELNVGDTIAISSYGGYADNSFKTVITAIEVLRDNIVIYFGENNNNICKKPSDMIKRVAQAATIAVAA